MKLWNKLAQDERVIHILLGVISLEFIFIIFLWIGWMLAPREMTIYVPPTLESGATLKADKILSSSVYAFTYYIWQAFNNWPENGREDYQQNLKRYSYFFTPHFQQQLKDQLTALERNGEVQSRIRIMRGLIGSAYEEDNVQLLKNGGWQVTLKVRVTEYTNGVVVKDTDIEYPLRVVRYDTNREYNPWGLAIDGFAGEPTRIKTYV